MGAPHLLVHDGKDTVGVVVVEGLKAGTDMLGVVTADNSDFRLTAKQDIPIGHKVALEDIKTGDTIWKYGQDIGRADRRHRARASTSTCTTSRRSGGERLSFRGGAAGASPEPMNRRCRERSAQRRSIGRANGYGFRARASRAPE